MNTKIGIFRALDVRFNHIDFAASFHKLQPRLIANLSLEMQNYLKKKHVQYHDIPLTPRFFIDPVYPLVRKTDFTPWLWYDQARLETITSDLDMYEIYEPYFFYSSQIADLAAKKKVPLITEIWTSFPEHPSRYFPPYSWNVKNVIQKTNHFVLRTKRALHFIEPYNIPDSSKTVIYQGVDVSRFSPAKKKHEKIRILIVGVLAAHKGLDDLLAVFPALVEKYSQLLELVICGDGPLREQVLRMSLDVPISYLGNVPNYKLHEIYRSCDIYCQPSKDYYFLGIKGGEEFAGYTFMEALACGLPIISTYCGGIPEIVGNDNLLIPQSDREQLFHALESYINNPSLRLDIGNINRKRAEEFFDHSKQTTKLEELIRKKFM